MPKRKKTLSEMKVGQDYTEQDLEFAMKVANRRDNQSIISIYREVYKPDENRTKGGIRQSMHSKLNSHKIQTLLEDFQNRMDSVSDLALDVAEDILRDGRSEKVKADLAIEFIRHRVGAPTSKNININENRRTVYVTVDDGTPEPANVVEGEVIA